MSIFEHQRIEIWNQSQHPFKHSLTDFAYSNSALPGVSNVQNAMDWITAVLYPIPKAAVANPAALPSVGNTLGDYRVVTDDGDGKSAGYRWEQREGDSVAKWYKIYDMDFGAGSVLQQAMNNAQALFVQKFGNDDLDSSGVAVAGTYAGQVIYGGKTASKNLTLRANAGDGTGASTGYVQSDDLFRVIPSGSASAPSYSFGSASTTGMYYTGSEIGWSTANFSKMTLGTRFLTINHSAANSAGLFINSTDNTSANSHAVIELSVGGASAGDPYLRMDLPSVNWAVGGDNSDSDSFKISANAVLGTNDYLTITAAGAFTTGASASTQTHTFNGLTYSVAVNGSGTLGAFDVTNGFNTPGSDARVSVSAAGSSGGNAFVQWNVNGATTWVAGINNGASDRWELGGSLGSPFLLATTAGAFTIGASAGSQTHSVNGSGLQLSAGSGTEFLLSRDVNNSTLTIVPNSTRVGSFISLYGNAHATLPNKIEFYNNGDLAMSIGTSSVVTLFGSLTVSGTSAFPGLVASNFVGATDQTYDLGSSSRAWANAFIGLLQGPSSGGASIRGTITNNNASAGLVGEYIESVVAAQNAGSTGVWTNLTSISLTAGDWDVSALLSVDGNGASITNNRILFAISVNSGATTTDQVVGSNQTSAQTTSVAGAQSGCAIPVYRLSLSTTTIVYFKTNATYVTATPQLYGRISARRTR